MTGRLPCSRREQEIEAQLERDADLFGGQIPDVLAGLEFRPRNHWAARGRTAGRACVCGALLVFLLVGARERAGLERVVRLVPAANSRSDAPLGPVAAVKDVAAFLAGNSDTPLREELDALARDAKELLEQWSKRAAPVASLLMDSE